MSSTAQGRGGTFNAVKYGALSNAQGRVMVHWHLADDSSVRRLRLQWEEAGGPTVEKPTRKGFGSVLLTRALANDLGAVVEVNPTGLVCTIDAPLPVKEEPRPARTRT
jgi:two-component sensor histidine kinase